MNFLKVDFYLVVGSSELSIGAHLYVSVIQDYNLKNGKHLDNYLEYSMYSTSAIYVICINKLYVSSKINICTPLCLANHLSFDGKLDLFSVNFE
jgi:hypothetical protein